VASVNDNVYVNIIANTQGFTDKMKSALQPIRQFTQVLNSIMAMGGAAMVINKVVQAVGDMEKAYAKLHPESQRAVGSLASWNEAMATMKAQQGAIVAGVLTPIRAAFQDLIDPIGTATAELRKLRGEMQAISDKYLTSDRKAFESRADALKQLAAAQKTYNDAVSRQVILEKDVRAAQADYQSKVSAAQKMGTYGNVDQVKQFAQTVIDKATAAADANRKLISTSLGAQRNINEWLAENNKAATDTVKKEEALKTVATEVNRVYQERLETAQDYMDVMDQVYQQESEALGTGTKGSSKGVSRKTRGRKDAADKTDDETEAVKELSAEWEKYADLLVSISASLGEAFVTGDYITAIKQMTTALLDFIAKEAIAAGLKQILAGNIPFGIALLALGGITMGISAGARSADWGGGGGGGHSVELPHMASGGIVTRPTLAMIGEAGPEAVVPLGRGGGGTTIIVQGSIWQTEDLARAVAGAQARW
jgi:hypothetical protein